MDLGSSRSRSAGMNRSDRAISPGGGWGIAGDANTGEDITDLARGAFAGHSR